MASTWPRKTTDHSSLLFVVGDWQHFLKSLNGITNDPGRLTQKQHSFDKVLSGNLCKGMKALGIK
jgi:hypothetical protein